MRSIEFLKAGANCLDLLADHGLSVNQVHDFEEAQARMLALGKPGITPILSPDFTDFTEASGFWFFLTDGERDLGGTGARFDNIGGESVETYWPRLFRRNYPSGEGPTTQVPPNSAAQNLRGRLIYLGDLYFDSRVRGQRDVLETFIWLLHMTAALKWDFDWIYAFMRQRDVELGFSVRYGFTRAIPNAQNWLSTHPGRGSTEYLVMLPRAEFLDGVVRRALRV